MSARRACRGRGGASSWADNGARGKFSSVVVDAPSLPPSLRASAYRARLSAEALPREKVASDHATLFRARVIAV